MGQIDGFIKYDRKAVPKQSVEDRVTHFDEFVEKESKEYIESQSARCMDCGVPFCHNGCPLGNRIPEFNDAVYNGSYKQAYDILISTNNFPEFTGRICPAPCEASCVLGINSDAVTIETIEKSIIEMAFENQWVQAKVPDKESGKKTAIIGSGPAGLACADELRIRGHQVTVYEKSDQIGGLLRYGIPNFKLNKSVVDRRIQLMEQAGIDFVTNANIGVDINPKELIEENDAVVICAGSSVPRDLNVEGRDLQGIYFAMDFLTQVTKRLEDETAELIDCKGKNILVIGGGDTGSDCIGSSNRLGARSVVQLELLSKPPTHRTDNDLWPLWPMILRTSSSHEEGAQREWSIVTKRFLSDDRVHLSGVETVRVEWNKDKDGKYNMIEIPNSIEIIPCDIAFLAIGFLHPLLEGQLSQLGISLDHRSNIKTTNYHTSVHKLFAAGDARMGQSLVVHAIAEGRKVAESVDDFLSESNTQIEKVFAKNPYAI